MSDTRSNEIHAEGEGEHAAKTSNEDRRKEVNSLAVKARTGDNDARLRLWGSIVRFAQMKAGLWVARNEGRFSVTEEDLTQAGYFAMLRALEWWEETKGAFITAFALCLQTEFYAACGIKRGKADPVCDASRLEDPIRGTDGDQSKTVADVIADELAEDPFAAVEDADEMRARRKDISTALDLIPEDRAAAVRDHYIAGQRPESAVRRQLINKGLGDLRRGRPYAILCKWKQEARAGVLGGTYRGTGLTAFRNKGASSVEIAAMKLEQL